MRRSFIASALLACTLIPGCGAPPLDVTREYTLEPGETKILELEPQKKVQKITIDVKFDDAVDIFVLSPDQAVKFLELKPDAAEENALTYKRRAQAEKIQFDLPANTPVGIVVYSPKKKTTGSVHVTNKS